MYHQVVEVFLKYRVVLLQRINSSRKNGYLICLILSIIDCSSPCKTFLFHVGAQLIHNAVLVSGVQPSDSITHVSILFQSLFSFRLLQITEQHSLCYTVGPCWLSILNIKLGTLDCCPLRTVALQTHS